MSQHQDASAVAATGRRILLAMLLGFAAGLLIFWMRGMVGLGTEEEGAGGALLGFVVQLLHSLGRLFVNALKMIVVPLVFLSLICGVSNVGVGSLGRLGGMTLGLYLGTTALAICIALTLASLVDPGSGISLGDAESLNLSLAAPPSLWAVLEGIIPTNPIRALAEGNMLPIIAFSLLFGVAVNLCGDAVRDLRSLLFQANDAMMKLVMMIISVAPIGIFCLVADVFGREGPEVFRGLVAYAFCLIGGLLLQAVLVYGTLLTTLARVRPAAFVRKVLPAMLFAFSTSSSNATIPVTLRTLVDYIGVNRRVASLTVPLGATINMDGTAIMQGTAVLFIAGAYGVDLSAAQLAVVVLTVTLASIGTAGVPSAGLVMLTLVLEQAGLPLEAIGILLGVDRVLDMMRTSINICGDCVISCVVANSEGELDRGVLYTPMHELNQQGA